MSSRRTLIITGMHRSGTSFTANLMGLSGLDLGPELIGATPSNILGHFEDKGILEFHEAMLHHSHTTMYAGIKAKIKYNSEHVAQARALVEERDRRNVQWGWKQPRACLFFKLWREVMPDAHYLITYRDYMSTLSSIYNREYNKLSLNNPPGYLSAQMKDFIRNKAVIYDQYISMWIRHNREIVKHLAMIDPQKFLVLSFKDLVDLWSPVSGHMIDQWGFTLTQVDAREIYRPELVHPKGEAVGLLRYKSTARSVMTELKKLRNSSLKNLRI